MSETLSTNNVSAFSIRPIEMYNPDMKLAPEEVKVKGRLTIEKKVPMGATSDNAVSPTKLYVSKQSSSTSTRTLGDTLLRK